MVKPESGGEGSQSTIIFPKKSAWAEASEAKRLAKKRAASANGTFSTVLARLVEDEHMDRRACRMVLALDAIEDDEDLHITVHQLIDGMKKLGILKRAMAQEEMFDENRIDTDAVEAVRGKGKGRGKKGDAAKDAKTGTKDNVTQIGDAARRVAEQAGGPAAAG